MSGPHGAGGRLWAAALFVAGRSPLAWLLLGLLAVYRVGVSPFLAPRCRFEPSCSVYAEVAVRRHGAVRGGWLILRRLARCQPWGGWGVDEVPPDRRHEGRVAAVPVGAAADRIRHRHPGRDGARAPRPRSRPERGVTRVDYR